MGSAPLPSDMNGGAERNPLFVAIERTVCPDPAVEFVVAFGSQLTGDAHSGSDLDIAVKFVDELSDRDRFRKRCFLSGDVQRPDQPHVDVVDIESLPIDVAHDAINGEVVCGEMAAFRAFKATVEAKFEQQRETIRGRQRDVIDRIAEDGLRG